MEGTPQTKDNFPSYNPSTVYVNSLSRNIQETESPSLPYGSPNLPDKKEST